MSKGQSNIEYLFIIVAAILVLAIIFLAINASISSPKTIQIAISHDGAICKDYSGSVCGINLFDCSNGNTYKCEKDVTFKMIEVNK